MLALKSKLKKDKFLSNEPSIQTAILKLCLPEVTLPSEGMTNKLESRLLSSRTLSGTVNGVISSLCSTLQPTATEDHENDLVEGSDRSRKLQNDNLVAAKSRTTLEESKDNPEYSSVDRITSAESDTDNEHSAEPEGDTSSDGDSTTGGGPLLPRASTPSSDYSSDRTSHIPHVGGVSKAPGTNSVFLPTLSNGFIPGGSDTDWSDGEANAGGSARKNRRGQRARRA